jgi:signal transduction histidine kinase
LHRLRLRQSEKKIQARVMTQQLERERIADGLHDTLLQSVQGLMMMFHSAVENSARDGKASEAMTRALELAQQVVDDGRDQMLDLRSHLGVDVDLDKGLMKTAAEFSALSGVKIDFAVDFDRNSLSMDAAEACYRVGREAMFNAARHSGTVAIHVRIHADPTALTLEVIDDGRGISQDVLESGRPGHRGLAGMRARARQIGGSLEVISQLAQGTTIRMSVPARIAFKDRGWLSEWIGRRAIGRRPGAWREGSRQRAAQPDAGEQGDRVEKVKA